ncbi:hypothetical protein Tco_0221189 [Tanacetum coccineum]
MSATAIEELITQRVADALADYDANQNIGNGNDNGNGSHDSGSGGGRMSHIARVCTYKEFLNSTALLNAKTVGHDLAYGMPWKTLMKMMTENYCPRSEIKKLETELWNLTVKADKVERYVGGLPDNIQGSMMKSEPKILQEAIELARSLMEQKVLTYAARQADNKKRMDKCGAMKSHLK